MAEKSDKLPKFPLLIRIRRMRIKLIRIFFSCNISFCPRSIDVNKSRVIWIYRV